MSNNKYVCIIFYLWTQFVYVYLNILHITTGLTVHRATPTVRNVERLFSVANFSDWGFGGKDLNTVLYIDIV